MFQKGSIVRIGVNQAKVIDIKHSNGSGFVVLTQNQKGKYAVHYYTEYGFSTGFYSEDPDQAREEFAARR